MDTERVTSISPARGGEVDQDVLCAAGVGRLLGVGPGLVEACQAVSSEMLAFWQSRLKESLATGRRLLECDSVEGALEVQLEYLKAAIQAYVDQTAKIGNLASRSLARIGEPSRAAPSGMNAGEV